MEETKVAIVAPIFEEKKTTAASIRQTYVKNIIKALNLNVVKEQPEEFLKSSPSRRDDKNNNQFEKRNKVQELETDDDTGDFDCEEFAEGVTSRVLA